MDEIFGLEGTCRVICPFKKISPAIFGSEFLPIMQNTFISEMVWDRLILAKFLAQRVSVKSSALSSKNCSHAICSSHLESYVKCIYLTNGVRWGNFGQIFGSEGCSSHMPIFQESVLLPFFKAHLNLYKKWKSTLILNRAIYMISAKWLQLIGMLSLQINTLVITCTFTLSTLTAILQSINFIAL